MRRKDPRICMFFACCSFREGAFSACVAVVVVVERNRVPLFRCLGLPFGKETHQQGGIMHNPHVCHMSKQIGKWKEGGLGWFRAACTKDPTNPFFSVLNIIIIIIITRDIPKDSETWQRSMAYLHYSEPVDECLFRFFRRISCGSTCCRD
jgi:hypothetical protein